MTFASASAAVPPAVERLVQGALTLLLDDPVPAIGPALRPLTAIDR